MILSEEYEQAIDSMVIKRVYLDVCALGRQFDNQQQARVRLETNAIDLILSTVRKSTLTLVVSQAHKHEIRANPKLEQREYLLRLLDDLGSAPPYDLTIIRSRAEQLTNAGMGVADATHVAFAEFAGADFVSVDDQLLKQCRRFHVKSWSGSPLAYCDKEGLQ